MDGAPTRWSKAATRVASLALGALFLGTLLGLPVVAIRWGVPLAAYPVAAAWALLAALLIVLAARAPLWITATAALAAAALLRIGVLAALHGLDGVETGNDYDAYLTLARNLAGGNGLIAHTMNFGWVRALYPPLYPILLAGAGAVGGFGAGTVLALNGAIDLASAGLIFLLGRRLGDPRAGLAAASLYLIWPSAALTAPLAQKEGLVGLLALVIAFMFHKLLTEGPGWRSAALLGLSAAAMGLTQPGLVLLPLSFALVLLPFARLRPLLLFGARALPFAILAMLPWWIRNYALFGAFVPLTTSMGPSMMSAAGALPFSHSQLLMTGDEPLRSAMMMREAGGLIAADPIGFVTGRIPLMARQMVLEDYDALRLAGFSPPIAWARTALMATQLSFACAAGLAFAALARKGAAASRLFLTAILLGCLLHILLLGPWFEFGERHRHFITPFLLLLAGSFAVRILPGPRTEAQEGQ